MHIDRTRTPAAKARALSRKAQRTRKSALLFLTLAFDPPAGSMANPHGAR